MPSSIVCRSSPPVTSPLPSPHSSLLTPCPQSPSVLASCYCTHLHISHFCHLRTKVLNKLTDKSNSCSLHKSDSSGLTNQQCAVFTAGGVGWVLHSPEVLLPALSILGQALRCYWPRESADRLLVCDWLPPAAGSQPRPLWGLGSGQLSKAQYTHHPDVKTRTNSNIQASI